ncbi:hypothetical protein CAFE_17510 [Caprobacter fermentans]|uniref:Recombinase family protein n=1 Tax=Caproicibacter fermentans TaxID=2576756 RepID=A0A6N8HZB5_9FIRM|nr:recombinase family protein [Caproicibacter fermentans]MVB11049.1 hypothetical protein [Caproicibacter fermentans]
MIAIYARQSIERPDSVSIDAQIEQCRRLAQEDAQTYSDVGYSGKNTKRPEFERMIQDIKEGKITAVVSYRLDRISRNIIDFANLLSLFEKYGVKYMSATEQFDTSTPMGRAMIYIVMVFAQLERETISTRISDNYRYRSAFGLFMGGNTPFGYDRKRIPLDGKKVSVLTPNEQAPVLQRIFRMFTSHSSMVSICHELNREGIKTAKGNLWTNHALRRVLENISPCRADERLYDYLSACGYNLANGLEDFDGEHGMCLFFKNKNRNQETDPEEQTAVVGIHPPILSSEEYIAAQQILASHHASPGKRSQRTFLTGLVQCQECGHSFGIKFTQRGDRHYAYFHCRGRESRGVCENNKFIPAEELESGILDLCIRHLSKVDIKQTPSEPEDHYRVSSAQAQQIRLQINNLVDNIGKGNSVVDGLLTKKITALQTQLDDLNQKTRVQKPRPVISQATLDWLKNQLSEFDKLELPQKRDAIQRMIKTVWIDKNGTIKIEYLF